MKSRFFPMFMDIGEKRILFVGAGTIATRRVKVLSGFETSITVVAPEISSELSSEINRLKANDEESTSGNVTYLKQEISQENMSGILDDYDIVFACTDDHDLNHEIYTVCRAKGILVNNCSNHNECDFYFPGIVQKENVVVAVNAGGNAHSQARQIREKIQYML